MKEEIKKAVTRERGLKESIIDLLRNGGRKLYDSNLAITIERNDINVRFAGLDRARVGIDGLTEGDACEKILKTVNGLRAQYHAVKSVLDEYRRKSDNVAHLGDYDLHHYIHTSSQVEIKNNRIHICQENSYLGYPTTVEIPTDARPKFKNSKI